jgi:2-(1,2-epoxy-1,2-dihydrophenyl)acetyl-CoA isomerase
MLLTDDKGPVRWLTLNRPERKNAVPPSGWSELGAAMEQFAESEQRVLVVAGAGGDFCAGADLTPTEAAGDAGPAGVIARHRRMKVLGDAVRALHGLAKPTIAAVDGVAVGAGMNLALACDFVIASDRVRFSEIFVRRGLTVDFGGTWLLPRIVGLQRAKLLALTGRIVEATEAVALGLAIEVVSSDRLEDRVTELALELAAGAPIGQMLAKQGLNRSFGMTFETAIAYEAQAQAICLGTDDAAEGRRAFQEKRPPEFRGR